MDNVCALETVRKDERWKTVVSRFAALEAQLQELYWEVLDCINEDTKANQE
jgi:hypothetical protein